MDRKAGSRDGAGARRFQDFVDTTRRIRVLMYAWCRRHARSLATVARVAKYRNASPASLDMPAWAAPSALAGLSVLTESPAGADMVRSGVRGLRVRRPVRLYRFA